MTRFVHDEFAKDYLEELLKSYGEVKSSEKISGEIKEIDVLFTPSAQQNSNLEVLGLLGKFAEFPAILEPFRNAASGDEICDCLQKLLEVKAGLRRDAKANKTKLQESNIPKLWILTPTASSTILSSFNVNQKEGWLPGVYFLGDALRTAIVAIHQLPQTPGTLWLRILGRGSVQSQAILELSALPLNHPYKQATLELVYNLRENLRINQNLESDDRELIMRLEPLYQQDRERAKEEGQQDLIIRQLNRRWEQRDFVMSDWKRAIAKIYISVKSYFINIVNAGNAREKVLLRYLKRLLIGNLVRINDFYLVVNKTIFLSNREIKYKIFQALLDLRKELKIESQKLSQFFAIH